jgi:hypothetical protein
VLMLFECVPETSVENIIETCLKWIARDILM